MNYGFMKFPHGDTSKQEKAGCQGGECSRETNNKHLPDCPKCKYGTPILNLTTGKVKCIDCGYTLMKTEVAFIKEQITFSTFGTNSKDIQKRYKVNK